MTALSGDNLTILFHVEGRSLPPPPRKVRLPDYEDEHFDTEAELGYAEGQSFMIEYVDSSGRHSTRRITVWGLKTGVGGVPLLIAFCHEREAQRTFRTDRIRAIIDYSGEVHDDVPAFLNHSLGMPIDTASRASDPEDAAMWNRFRDANASHLSLFVALSKADAVLLPEEAGVIADWCLERARSMRLAIPESFRHLAIAFVRRLRPTQQNIANALERLHELGPDDLLRFFTTAVQVIDADGHRHPQEISLLNDLAEDLMGVPIV